MQYWRMQLHPNDSSKSAFYASKSLSAGFIGLDFEEDLGPLNRLTKSNISDNRKDYFDFFDKMQIGDKVLIIAHHFPVAVVTVSGNYNYILQPELELGIWFRHFRKVKDIIFYADFNMNLINSEKIIMTNTISVLTDRVSKSYKLIDNMYNL